MISKLFKRINTFKKFSKFNIKKFADVVPSGGVKKVYGNLKDTDRIFTNVYRDGDPFIDGAIKRVNK
jgi:hypothetical protein